MSYELFRSQLIAKLTEEMDMSAVEKLISAVDTVADGYDIARKTTDIIVRNGVPEVVKYYIAAKSIQHLSHNTLSNYYSFLQRFFKCVNKNPDSVTANDIRVFLGRYKIDNNITNSTLENKRVILHSFFSWCHEEGITNSNPCVHVNPIKGEDNHKEPMDRDELEIMRESCKDKRETALVDFLYSTGCRISEVAAMKLEDIDWNKRIVTVQHGKGDKKRITFLSPKAYISVRSYMSDRDDSCPYLFVDKRTTEKHGIKSKALQREIHNIWLRTGLKHKITPHIYRHTAGTLASASGMPIEHVQRFLGHESIKTTMRYVKVYDEDVQNSHKKYAS